MIYFVRCEGKIKVGYTENVTKRLSELQSANPFKLELMAFMPGTRQLEGLIHDMLKSYKVRGEWFRGKRVRRLAQAVYAGARPKTKIDVKLLMEYVPGRAYGPLPDGVSDLFELHEQKKHRAMTERQHKRTLTSV